MNNSFNLYHCCPVNFEMTHHAEAKMDIHNPKCLFIHTVIQQYESH
jgi:hypothetical protein